MPANRPLPSSRSLDIEHPQSTDADWTPRPSPAPNSSRFLDSIAQIEKAENPTATTTTTTTTKRSGLGYIADKLAPLHLHHHQHNNTKNVSPGPNVTSFDNTGLNPPVSSSKLHTSPSKPSYGRTYDSTFVSREMHRLAHLPAALAPSLSSNVPSSTTTLVPSASSGSSLTLASASSISDPWGSLHVHILPLFNAEPLRIPIEDLNVLVRRHVQTVVSSAPSKAVVALENDASELIGSGMVTLHAKLVDLKDEKLIGRVVETWGFFWDQVLPYVEGALLPLQTDGLLSSLYRTPKQRPSSPTRHNTKTSISSNSQLGITGSIIDVRTVALQSFRDKVILPFAPRLAKLLKDSVQDASYQQPRLQQMLLVLYSQTRQRLPTFSLTAPAPEPTLGEAAIANLLRHVRSPNPSSQQYNRRRTINPPNFLSHGTPRDRRGRIGDKDFQRRLDGDDDKTPTVRIMGDPEKGKEREYLEALRSPDYEHHQTGVRASAGWGLSAEDSGKEDEEEGEEPTDWDQAQAAVERMLGMRLAEKA